MKKSTRYTIIVSIWAMNVAILGSFGYISGWEFLHDDFTAVPTAHAIPWCDNYSWQQGAYVAEAYTGGTPYPRIKSSYLP